MTSLHTRIASAVLSLGTMFAVCGCAESPPAPPKPLVEQAEPLVERAVPLEDDGVEVSPVNPVKVTTPPTPAVIDVPVEPEIIFEGLSASEKLDRIAEVIRSSWGDGEGFHFRPETAAAESPEDQLVLTLRWMSVEEKITPLLERAFGIEGPFVCRFKSPGEFDCNHPVYQLAIQRAQNRPKEFAKIYRRVDATLPSTAPVLREQFLKYLGRETEFYQAIRLSLIEMELPGQLEFSGDDSDSSADDQQCVLFTKWSALPAEFENSTEAASFQWRLQLVVREAVDKLESEWANLSTTKNRLELISFAQYRRSQDKTFKPVGPLTVTAIGLDQDTTVMQWNKGFASEEVSGAEILSSLERFPSAGAYPNPATFVGVSDPMATLVKSVHQAITTHLTETVAE